MASPGTYNMTHVQGDDWSTELTVADAGGDPIDMTGYTFLAQARTAPGAATVAFTFTVDTTDAATGILVLTVADTVTDDLEPGRYFWDLQWTDGAGAVRTILAGIVTVLAEVSRP
jgi:hypothetical protein